MGGGRKSKSKKKSKPKTKAQKMAVANKAKYGGTAKAAAANKKSMQNKAKSYTKTSGAATAAAKNKAANKAAIGKSYQAKQAAKKAAPSKGASISKGTTGIGPVKSGSTYSKAVSNATNAPTKKTTGIGPYADGAKYAAALKASPPRFKDGTKVASSMSAGSYGGYVDAGESRGFVSPEQADKMIKNPEAYKMRPSETRYLRESMGLPLASAGNLTGLGIGEAKATGFTPTMPGLAKSLGIDSTTGLDSEGKGPSYLSIKSPESFGAPSQADVDAAAGITAGGLNIGGSGFTPSSPSGGSNARAIKPTGNPDVMSPDGTFNRPGPGGPEPEADYTSYQPGSQFNLSDVNMNVTNAGRVLSNVVRAPLRFIGIKNNLTDRLYMKDNEAIQDGIDQRGPRPTLTRPRSRGGGARLPVAPLTPEEILLPEAVAQTGPAYQQALPEQTGVDPNRLMQIQQEAYAQAFNPYNPLTVGGFNPFFRFFGRRGGGRRGAFRRAFRRD